MRLEHRPRRLASEVLRNANSPSERILMLRTAGLYIPETMPEVRKDIWDSRIDRATEELGRLAALGSSDAAAVLARMSQCGFEMPGTSEDDIYDSCRAAGQRGNAYAQYVAGVRESREHRWNSAVKWLQMSCDNNFAPACLQCGQIALWVSKKPRVAEKYFLNRLLKNSGIRRS